jgi:hypothetical protein
MDRMPPAPENSAAPADRAVANDYDSFAEAYSAETEANLLNGYYARPAILDLAGDVAGRRILDVGCGSAPMRTCGWPNVDEAHELTVFSRTGPAQAVPAHLGLPVIIQEPMTEAFSMQGVQFGVSERAAPRIIDHRATLLSDDDA